MKNLLKISALIIMSTTLFSSCADMTKKVEDKINALTEKAEMLDSIVNQELDKVLALDSILNLEGDKVKQLDSLINNSTIKIDSIANEKINNLKKIIN